MYSSRRRPSVWKLELRLGFVTYTSILDAKLGISIIGFPITHLEFE